MNRDYSTGKSDSVVFFTGIEVEKTPAFRMKTLFVVGVKPVETIVDLMEIHNCEHVYLGANHSFNPDGGFGDAFQTMSAWDNLIRDLMDREILTTLDFDVKHIQWLENKPYTSNSLFIPQISVKIPNLDKLNKNATLKIDDIDFKSTNRGVWCHNLNTLKGQHHFTGWDEYTKDDPI